MAEENMEWSVLELPSQLEMPGRGEDTAVWTRSYLDPAVSLLLPSRILNPTQKQLKPCLGLSCKACLFLYSQIPIYFTY